MSEDIVHIQLKSQRVKKYKVMLLAEDEKLKKVLRVLLDDSSRISDLLHEAEVKRDQSLAFISRQATSPLVDCQHVESAWRYVSLIQRELTVLVRQNTETITAIERQKLAIAAHQKRVEKADTEIRELEQGRFRWERDQESIVIEDNFVATRYGSSHDH
jgi:hypothetical protein